MSNFIIDPLGSVNHNSTRLFNNSFNQTINILSHYISNNSVPINNNNNTILYYLASNTSSILEPSPHNNYSFFGLYDITKAKLYKNINNV